MNDDVTLKKGKSHSCDENFAKPNFKKRFSRQLLKRLSLESMETKRYDKERHHNPISPERMTSPRIKITQDLICNSDIQKVKKLAKGYGSNSYIWEVNVIVNDKHNNLTDPYILNIKDNLKKCCMKEINIEQSSEDDLDMFMMEIDKLQRLPSNNNHIINFIGYNQTSTVTQIFTKLYDGCLTDIIKERKALKNQFTQEEVIDFLKQISSGLMVLHSRRMMHRDIKSDNIFYYKNGNKVNLVLGDFGESKIIDKYNKAKTCAGTNVWMAPEVLESFSRNEYTFKADIYSLGKLLEKS